jgi:hypothetical protein
MVRCCMWPEKCPSTQALTGRFVSLHVWLVLPFLAVDPEFALHITSADCSIRGRALLLVVTLASSSC